jgi:signal transduction protein with GAF and PtsI domain
MSASLVLSQEGVNRIRRNTVFSAILDINEVLSLSNETSNVLNMALDTMSQALKVECCWIQTINSGKQPLSLVASRGFSPEMEAEIASMDIDHDFSELVIGTGQKIIIPDLSNDGRYGLSSFGSAGYRWLVAVPLMTYRALGLLGIASRHKKNLQKETADLALVIGGMIATALNKADLFRKSLQTQNSTDPQEKKNDTLIAPREKISLELPKSPEQPPAPPEEVYPAGNNGFNDHAHKMELFRRSHRG